MKILLFFIIVLFTLVTLNGVLAETLTLTLGNKIDYNFTRNYQLEFKNYQLEINNVKIKPLVSVNGIETDLSKINYVVVVNDGRYFYNYSITLRDIALKNVDYIAFNLTGLRRLDDISYTDGKLRFIFDDLNAYGNLSLTDSKVILYNPTTLSIDPIIELLPNSTNKAFNHGSSYSDDWNLATTEYIDEIYFKVNVSDNNRYLIGFAESGCEAYTYIHDVYKFNLSNYGSVDNITYCIEGYYGVTYDGSSDIYFYNVTSGVWVYDQIINPLTEATKCKSFTTGISNYINYTDGIFKFGIKSKTMGFLLPPRYRCFASVISVNIDFINVTINYTVTTTSTTSTSTSTSTSTTSTSTSTSTTSTSTSTSTTSTSTSTSTSTTTTITETTIPVDLYEIIIYSNWYFFGWE